MRSAIAVESWNRTLTILHAAELFVDSRQRIDLRNITRILANPKEFFSKPSDHLDIRESNLWLELYRRIQSMPELPVERSRSHISMRLADLAYPKYVLGFLMPVVEETIDFLSAHNRELAGLSIGYRNIVERFDRLPKRVRRLASSGALRLQDQIAAQGRFIKSCLAGKRAFLRSVGFLRQEYMTSAFAFHAERVFSQRFPKMERGEIRSTIGLLENQLFAQNVDLPRDCSDCPAVKEQIRQWKHGAYAKFDFAESLRN